MNRKPNLTERRSRTAFDAVLSALGFAVALSGFFAPELSMMMAQ